MVTTQAYIQYVNTEFVCVVSASGGVKTHSPLTTVARINS